VKNKCKASLLLANLLTLSLTAKVIYDFAFLKEYCSKSFKFNQSEKIRTGIPGAVSHHSVMFKEFLNSVKPFDLLLK
jgi:hypothetical protein